MAVGVQLRRYRVLSVSSAGDTIARNPYWRGELKRIQPSQVAARLLAAAASGNPQAQYMVGLMYLHGAGLEPDERKAVSWIEKAAAQGLARAQNDLGTLYAEGRGVGLDRKQAIFWFNSAAAQGLRAARENLQELGQHPNLPHIRASSAAPPARH